MVASIVVSIITCLSMVGFIIIKPNFTLKGHTIGTYWIVSLIGSIILLIFSLVPYESVLNSIFEDSAINPIKILIIFTRKEAGMKKK